MINLEDSDVGPPSIQDFQAEDSTNAHVFVSYVEICRILGDLVEMRRKSRLTCERRDAVEKSLLQWLHNLPADLKLYGSEPSKVLSEYNLQSRQLHVIFFVSLIILSIAEDPKSASVTPIVAASAIATIFAEFQEYGDLQRLGPIFAFHGLAAALPLLSAQKFRQVAPDATLDFDKIYSALQELAEKWGSALGLLEPLAAAKKASAKMEISDSLPLAAQGSLLEILLGFGPEICSLWWLMPKGPHLLGATSSSATDQTHKPELQRGEDAAQNLPVDRQGQDMLTPGCVNWSQSIEFDNANHLQQPWEALPAQMFFSDESWMNELGTL